MRTRLGGADRLRRLGGIEGCQCHVESQGSPLKFCQYFETWPRLPKDGRRWTFAAVAFGGLGWFAGALALAGAGGSSGMVGCGEKCAFKVSVFATAGIAFFAATVLACLVSIGVTWNIQAPVLQRWIKIFITAANLLVALVAGAFLTLLFLIRLGV